MSKMNTDQPMSEHECCEHSGDALKVSYSPMASAAGLLHLAWMRSRKDARRGLPPIMHRTAPTAQN